MKIKANYVVYDYRTAPKSYRLQVTHSADGLRDDVLYQIERVILPSRIALKLNCEMKEIAPIGLGYRHNEPVLYRRVSTEFMR